MINDQWDLAYIHDNLVKICRQHQAVQLPAPDTKGPGTGLLYQQSTRRTGPLLQPSEYSVVGFLYGMLLTLELVEYEINEEGE